MTDYAPRLFTSDAEIAHLGEGLIARTLAKPEWTHEAHLGATTYLLLKRPDIHIDIFPIGHVGGRKGLSREIQESKKDFLFAGGLGLDNRAVIDRSDAVTGQQAGKPLRLSQQLLIGSFLKHRSDKRVKE